MKKMLRVRFVMTLMFAAAGISASRDARATTTCIDPSQDIYTPFNAGDGGSNPNVEYCTLAYVLNSGTGAALLTQDIGSANSSAYALESTSINNDGIIGTTAGGNGAAGVLGTNTGSGGIGVYGQTAAGYAFYGEDTSTGTGVYGVSYGGGDGVHGESESTSSSKAGVYGDNTATGGVGVSGNSIAGTGVYGTDTSSGTGVYGTSSTGFGVEGNTPGVGIYGVTSGTTSAAVGVYGRANSLGRAVEGYNPGSGFAGYFSGNLQVTGTPYCSGCTLFTSNSDSRLKKDIQPLQGAMTQLLKLRGVTFEWIDPAEHGNHQGMQRGFIAQDVEKVLPEWVGVDTKGFKTLNMTGIEPMLVESIRELKERVDKADAQNETLEERIKALEANRRPLISGLTAEGTLFGFGLITMAGAFVVTRRRRSES